jgi:putative transposase
VTIWELEVEITWAGDTLLPYKSNQRIAKAGACFAIPKKTFMRHFRLPRLDLPGHTYALTCCTHARQRFLAISHFAESLVGLFVEARDRGDILLHGYVIMPDHYHVVLTLAEGIAVTNLIRRIHSAFARKAKPELGITDRIWQRRFYDHVVRSYEDWYVQVSYLHGNPLRAGLVEDPVAYPWSSCRFWETGDGPVKCDPP